MTAGSMYENIRKEIDARQWMANWIVGIGRGAERKEDLLALDKLTHEVRTSQRFVLTNADISKIIKV